MEPTTQQKWEALPQRQRNALLERYHDINADYEWWLDTYSLFDEELEQTYGIRVTDHRFSGFWSQGDGASFEGRVADWEKLLTSIGEPELIPFAQEADWSFDSEFNSYRYCHSQSMAWSSELSLHENPYDEETDALRHDAWKLTAPTAAKLGCVEALIAEKFVDLADELYRRLEREYEDLTSEEAVTAYIIEYCEDEVDQIYQEEFSMA